jgi:hypothetical protein
MLLATPQLQGSRQEIGMSPSPFLRESLARNWYLSPTILCAFGNITLRTPSSRNALTLVYRNYRRPCRFGHLGASEASRPSNDWSGALRPAGWGDRRIILALWDPSNPPENPTRETRIYKMKETILVRNSSLRLARDGVLHCELTVKFDVHKQQRGIFT